MSMETFGNVFEALMDTPEEAANMTLRSDLMRAIRKEVQSWAAPRRRPRGLSASASRA
jgi:predicted XRE-type DNA-binding protein